MADTLNKDYSSPARVRDFGLCICALRGGHAIPRGEMVDQK